MKKVFSFLLALVLLAFAGPASGDVTLRDLARLEGRQDSDLHGFGFVVGLNGTGDGGESPNISRPMAQVYARFAMPIDSIEELEDMTSVALVYVTARIPAEGAVVGDHLDLSVSAVHTATDLRGGTLIICPLVGPMPGMGVYAMATGQVEIPDPTLPRKGVIAGGLRLKRDVMPLPLGDTFILTVDTAFSGHATTAGIAQNIQQKYYLGNNADDSLIADPIDARRIRITIPEPERVRSSSFVAFLMSLPIDLEALHLPSQIVLNRTNESIIVTGDVYIKPTAVSVEGMRIQLTDPEPVPTPANPVVRSEQYVGLATDASEREGTRLQVLLDTLNALEVPTSTQIEILADMHASGLIFGKLIER